MYENLKKSGPTPAGTRRNGAVPMLAKPVFGPTAETPSSEGANRGYLHIAAEPGKPSNESQSKGFGISCPLCLRCDFSCTSEKFLSPVIRAEGLGSIERVLAQDFDLPRSSMQISDRFGQGDRRPWLDQNAS